MARFRVMTLEADKPGVGVIAELRGEIHGDLAGIEGCFTVDECRITVEMAVDNESLDHDAAVIQAFTPYASETYAHGPEALAEPVGRMHEVVERFVLAFAMRSGRTTSLTWMGGIHMGADEVASGRPKMFMSSRRSFQRAGSGRCRLACTD